MCCRRPGRDERADARRRKVRSARRSLSSSARTRRARAYVTACHAFGRRLGCEPPNRIGARAWRSCAKPARAGRRSTRERWTKDRPPLSVDRGRRTGCFRQSRAKKLWCGAPERKGGSDTESVCGGVVPGKGSSKEGAGCPASPYRFLKSAREKRWPPALNTNRTGLPSITPLPVNASKIARDRE